MKRREFLKTGAMVVVGTAVAASGIVAEASAAEKHEILHPESC